MTRFVLYHRIAKDQRDPRRPRDDQLACCLAYIEAKGWADVAEYVDDRQGDAA
jgi:hypothetical protein